MARVCQSIDQAAVSNTVNSVMHTISTIKITGSDAFEFLQGQLTSDLRRLDGDDELLTAWCNPKGRVIWLGTMQRIESGFSISVPAVMADDVVRRLTMFRFRSRVEFEIVENPDTLDPAALIAEGMAFIGPEQSEQFTPHMLNLDLLDAISLDKGCYTGQEIIARTHYKGATKRRMLRFSCADEIAPGDKVQLDGRDVGEVLNVAGSELLAVVPVEKAGLGLVVNGTPLERLQ